MQEAWHRQVLSSMKTRQRLLLPTKGSIPLKRYNFLRINSMNHPFIYLQSLDNFGFDYEKDVLEQWIFSSGINVKKFILTILEGWIA